MDSLDFRFEEKRTAPVWWLNKANDLHASAGILWSVMNSEKNTNLVAELNLSAGFNFNVACRPVYEMLFGMSLELLFKAVVVVSDQEPIHTHNLVQLAALTGIEFSSDEKAAMEVLTHSIIWNGRYPVPAKAASFKEHHEVSSVTLFESVNDGPFKRYNNALDWNSLQQMWGKGVHRFFELYERY